VRSQRRPKPEKENKIMNKFKINNGGYRFIIAGGLVSAAMLVFGLALPVSPARAAGRDRDNANTQIAELYQLQAAFHREASVHDPINGDSEAVINQRIQDMLALWTDNAVLNLAVGNPNDGFYIGRGDVFTNCPMPSGDPSNRGTVCSFFKYVAGSFQPANKFISLAPSYNTSFNVAGNTAQVHFSCWYFAVSVDANGNPVLAQRSHPEADGTAQKINGRWLLSFINAPNAGIPDLTP
jgi:hypothetical protein